MIMGVAAVFSMFAGTYYWWPKMTGRMLGEGIGQVHFYATFIGVYAVFLPMHFVGIVGNPRRYADFTQFDFLKDLTLLHKVMTHAALFTFAVQFLFLFNLLWSLRRGVRAPANPWDATTLEWTLASPVPEHNFGSNAPVVHCGAYEYSVPGAERDFRMQNEEREA
jgi:cytochrome c oxidase subunit 1